MGDLAPMPAMTRQATGDFLNGLEPDGLAGDDMILADFDQYVETLGVRGLGSLGKEQVQRPIISGSLDDILQSAPLPDAFGMPPIPSAPLGNGQQLNGFPAFKPSSATLDNHNIPTTAPQNGWHQDADMNGSEHTGDSGDKRPSHKPKRNPKQQQQNKAAQQRYRERRKQRFSDMEHTIDEMSGQLKGMAETNAQNVLLQRHAQVLQQSLSAKDKEVEDLRNKLFSLSPADGAAAEVINPQAEVAALHAEFEQDVIGLQQFLDAHGLEHADGLGQGVDQHTLQALAEQVQMACKTCHRAMRGGGIKILELINTDLAKLKNIPGGPAKWRGVLEALQLSPEQQEQVMTMRYNHMDHLREVLTQRQKLNMQAMSIMVPAMSSDGESGPEARLRCIGEKGYTCAAGKTVELNRILDAIKENLRLEQRRVMELNFVTVHRVLSPIQAARYLIMMFPEHCAGLSLANALAESLGRTSSGDPKSSSQALEGVRSSSSGGVADSHGAPDSRSSQEIAHEQQMKGNLGLTDPEPWCPMLKQREELARRTPSNSQDLHSQERGPASSTGSDQPQSHNASADGHSLAHLHQK